MDKGYLSFMKPENLQFIEVVKETKLEIMSVETGEILDTCCINKGDTNLDLTYIPASDCPYMLELDNGSIDFELKGTSLKLIDYRIPETVIDGIFENCIYLHHLSPKVFENNHMRDQLFRTFKGCVSLDPMTTKEALDAFDIVTCMVEVFYNTKACYLGSELFRPNMSKLNNLTKTFAECRGLVHVDVDIFKNIPNLYSVNGLFENCGKFEFVHPEIFNGLDKLAILTDVFVGTGIKKVNKNFLCSLNPKVIYNNLFPPCVELNEYE